MAKDNYYAEYWHWQDDSGTSRIYSAYETVKDDEYLNNDGRPDVSECLDFVGDAMERDGFKGIDEGNHKHQPECIGSLSRANITEKEFLEEYEHKHLQLSIKKEVK